ncbi:Low affinity K(+) transporter 1 [Paramyrothecium foliicola]|nr:Low affinity K(+) transporter 1 [Paramyrothecium foliicola]
MGCLSHRRKQTEELVETRWEYISLNDFKATGCGTQFAYGYLWFLLLLSIVFYAVDIFTAVNLLAFNRWASQIQPAIPFDIIKWIFSVCIILSIINLVYEGIRASRVMKRGNVAECYLDSLAVRWESLRLGSGQGWKRFLVFAELTKSKKGTEYIALFTYFSFQGWIRVLVCSGPRQVVNAMTLISVYQARFNISNASVEGSISEFFQKIKLIAEDDYRQAVILSGMLFTLVIWAFSMLFLIMAILFYVCFLFHWIPRADGGLSGYCERKVNKALRKVVTEKVNKALAKGQMKAEMKNGKEFGLERAATLPTLPNVGVAQSDSLPSMPVLARQDTNTTLPAYTPTGATASFELGSMDQKRPVPSRTGTMASDATYSSRAPLTAAAADMGYGRPASPAPRVPNIDPSIFPPRPGTSNSQRSMGSRAGGRPNADFAPQSAYAESLNSANLGRGASTASRPQDGYNKPMANNGYPGSNLGPRQYTAYNPDARSADAQYAADSFSDSQWDNRSEFSSPGMMNRPPYPPARSATAPMPPRGPQYPPQRNLTGPNADYMDRAPTSHSMRDPRTQGYGQAGRQQPQNQRGPSYGYDLEGQRDRMY